MKENTWRKEYQEKQCKNCGKSFSRNRSQLSCKWKQMTCCSKECKVEFNCKKLTEGLLKKSKPKPCLACGDIFQPKNQNHYYCGSKKYKEGCSYKYYKRSRAKSSREHNMRGARKLWLNTTKIGIR